MEPDNPEEQRPGAPSRRQVALFRALPIAILTLLCGAVIVFLVLRTAGGVRQSQEVVARFAPLADVCNSAAVAAAAPYGGGAGPHPVVAFQRLDGEWVFDPSVLPASWFPATLAEAELVLCLQETEPVTAPRCTAEAEGTVPTRVYGYRLPLKLVAARSGDLVVEDTLSSAARSLECWPAADEPEAIGISSEQIHSLIRPYVALSQ